MHLFTFRVYKIQWVNIYGKPFPFIKNINSANSTSEVLCTRSLLYFVLSWLIRGRWVTHMDVSKICQYWFTCWLVAYLVPSHYLHQWLMIDMKVFDCIRWYQKLYVQDVTNCTSNYTHNNNTLSLLIPLVNYCEVPTSLRVLNTRPVKKAQKGAVVDGDRWNRPISWNKSDCDYFFVFAVRTLSV